MYSPWGPGFVMFCIIAGCATVVAKHYFRSRANGGGFGREDMVSRAEHEASLEQIGRLEERVRVLERIVTSKRDRLARELSELED